MKRYIIYSVIAVISAIWFYISYCAERKEMLKVAEATLIKAVHEDLNNRTVDSDALIYSKSISKKEYKHVEITHENEKKTYQLDSVNSSKNIDKDLHTQILHTIAILNRQYAHPDTLNQLWQKELQAKGINHIKTFIDITISTRPYRAQNRDSLAGKHYTSLPTFYAGAKNEMKLQPAIDLTFFSILNYNLLLYIFWGIIGGCIGGIIVSFLQTKQKTEITSEKSEDNFWLAPPNIRLSDNVAYAPDASIIYRDGKVVTKLPPHPNLLLKLLAEAENHRMHGADLVKAIWGDDEINLDKLYTLNSRLRKILKEIDTEIAINSLKDGYFQLTYPYLSKGIRV
ncbi:hypothetical protein [Phocaeicola faecalis]|uniref:hypothetical protein n=1 Tax=Phocaeicola faecalis TaxID=2786956 RepID=UPI001F199F23|nr:hypothetical protein [Phocaeicola faecalis]